MQIGGETNLDKHSYSVPTILTLILIALTCIDLYRQYFIQTNSFWFQEYQDAVLSDDKFWQLGYRMENLELKLESQEARLKEVRHSLTSLLPRMKINMENLRGNMHDFRHTRAARIAMHELLTNDSAIYRIRCGTGGKAALLRIGVDDFRTDSRDSCNLYTDSKAAPPLDSSEGGVKKARYSPDRILPQSYFEMVPLSEGAFALRPISAGGRFLQVVPPTNPDAFYAYTDPWKVTVGGVNPGQLERFRLYAENRGGLGQDVSAEAVESIKGNLYSAAMDGYLTCENGRQLQGTAGGSSRQGSTFVFEKVSDKDVRYAQEVVSLSDQIADIQSSYSATSQMSAVSKKAAVKAVTSASAAENSTPVRICIAVPITSKGTKMAFVKDSPFWPNLFDSFISTIDWHSNRYVFRFYLGLDKADAIYDTGDAWSEIRSIFLARARYRLEEKLLPAELVDKIVDPGMGPGLQLKIMHFDHLAGAPSQIVSQLVLAAYTDKFDYFYQVNDDTVLESANWAPALIGALAGNPFLSNFGVTGPLDTNNDRIFTHSFVHRSHVEVFGHMFPPAFKNWWSDDWISTVYGKEHTFRLEDVRIRHNIRAQKAGDTTRYEVDHGAQLVLGKELTKGFVQVDTWLKRNSKPRLSLPVVCEYVPMTRYLYKYMKHASYNAKEEKDAGEL